MKIAKIKLRQTEDLTFGKFHQAEKLPKELADDYERRTWREKCHYDVFDNVIIPGTMIANCIRESAKFLTDARLEFPWVRPIIKCGNCVRKSHKSPNE